MGNENVLEFLFSHLNLDVDQIITMSIFYSKHQNDGITLENFQERYNEWLKSDEGRQVCQEIRQKESAEEDAQIQKGLTSIERGNYSILWKYPRCGAYAVRDNETNLSGLITEDKKEIFPCIFGGIDVSLDGFIEVTFKGHRYSFYFLEEGSAAKLKSYDEKKLKEYFIYAETESYRITREDRFDYHGNEDDPIVQKLFDLLNVNHSVK